MGYTHHALDEDARCDDAFWIQIAQLNKFLDLHNRGFGCHTHDWTEIALRLAIHQIARSAITKAKSPRMGFSNT